MKKPKFTDFNDSYRKRLYAYLKAHLPKMSEKEMNLIRKAYILAWKTHYGIRRKGGEREAYITHPVEVAIIIAKEMGFGPTSIAAALLHDVVEDCKKISIKDIEKTFGSEIATIVDGVTKITQKGGNKENIQNATLVKMIMKFSKDFRVLLIKVADRLHNMRTMEDMPEATKKIKSSENLLLYSKLAGMAGLWQIKKELEDRSFRYLYPKEYQELENIQKKSKKTKIEQIQNLHNLLNELVEIEYDYDITIIERSLYSVWKKIQEKNIDLDSIHNHYSTRIIVNMQHIKNQRKEKLVKRKILHNIFLQITDFYNFRNIRDWIKTPKKNGFSALVFDIMNKGQWQEIQILSQSDHIIAEKGWIDKEHAPGLRNLQNQIKEKIEHISELLDDIENLGSLNVYTPQGKKIELPKKSTILDFAYRIHTELGNKCIGGKINNSKEIYPRNYVLKENSIVEILTDDKVVPTESWLQYTVTPRAKKAINNYLKTVTKDKKQTAKKITIDFNYKKPLIINDQIDFKLAECCHPLIGDNAVAVFNDANEIIIHKDSCENAINARATNPQRTAMVKWEYPNKDNAWKASVHFEGKDRLGILQEIATIISRDLKFNMNAIKAFSTEDLFYGDIELFVSNSAAINELIEKLQSIEGMEKVVRQ